MVFVTSNAKCHRKYHITSTGSAHVFFPINGSTIILEIIGVERLFVFINDKNHCIQRHFEAEKFSYQNFKIRTSISER